MRPDHGGRLELKLVQASDASARYALTLFTPESEVTAEVMIESSSGVLEFDAWQGPPPPEWLEAFARALLRTVWRSKISDNAWPRRVTRWRPAPKP